MGETFSVDGARTELAQGSKVLLCGVAFVLGEAILGVAAIVSDHQAVADDFGDDAGGADERANFVTIHDEQGGNAQVAEAVTVHQN